MSPQPPTRPHCGVQVAGVPQQPNGHDCGVYTALMADAVCQAMSEMRQEGGDMLRSDQHGVEVTRRILVRTKLISVQHAVLYRILVTRALIQEWHRGGRGGDVLGRLSAEDATNILADARWDRHLQSPPFSDKSEEELRYAPPHPTVMSRATCFPRCISAQ